MFPSAYLTEMANSSGPSMGVYFPFETASGLFLEPLITYFSSSNEKDYDDYAINDYENSNVSWGISLGIFKSTYLNKIRTYVGVRFGKAWITTEQTGYDDEGQDALIISPTFGVEYFINENFSFGGEAMYSMLSSEDEVDENWDNLGNYNGGYTETTKSSMIIPKFMVRFYY